MDFNPNAMVMNIHERTAKKSRSLFISICAMRLRQKVIILCLYILDESAPAYWSSPFSSLEPQFFAHIRLFSRRKQKGSTVFV